MNPDPHNRTSSREEHFRRYARSYRDRTKPRRLYGAGKYDSHGDAVTELISDWSKPRYALPSLKYLSPLSIGLAQAYAAMVFGTLSFASYQLWHAYSSGEGLDASSVEFIGPAIMFLVAAIGAAAQLRRVTLRLALRRQAKAETVIHEHEILLSPIEAGIMIDAYSNSNEILATLTSLEIKGYLDDSLSGGQSGLRLRQSEQQLTVDEAIFLKHMFNSTSEISESDVDSALRAAGSEMHKAAFKRLLANGDVPLLSAWGKIQYFVLRTFSIVGFAIGLLLFSLLFNENSYRINYPRYPVELWQLGFIVLLMLILVAVPLQAYFTKVFTKRGMEKYRQAAGLYMYIETVLKGKFEDGHLAKSERDYYLPYAQALGLDE